MQILIMVVAGFWLDLLLGDPHSWPHPVKVMGRLIYYLTNKFNQPAYSSHQKRWLGIMTWIITVGLSGIIIYFILYLCRFNQLLYLLVGTYFSYTCISTQQLAIEARKVIKLLQKNDLALARQQLAMIVGRDTKNLNREEILKATIETVAENTSDGVIAPLCYLMLGGPTLGIIYKSINTLDSMIGYNNEKYRDFGRFAAKCDDLVNYLPARITWLLLIISGWILQGDVHEAWLVGKRDCKKHLSPNSAFPEAVVAGMLHLQLGGPHYYFGKLVNKPYIGDDFQVMVNVNHLKKTITMLYVTAIIALIILVGLRLIYLWKWPI